MLNERIYKQQLTTQKIAHCKKKLCSYAPIMMIIEYSKTSNPFQIVVQHFQSNESHSTLLI
jgi:hypothetical protein